MNSQYLIIVMLSQQEIMTDTTQIIVITIIMTCTGFTRPVTASPFPPHRDPTHLP